MSLINLLNAAGIKTNLMLLSTRQRGFPKKTHPVMSDFNYSIAKVTIDGKDYLLDATNKYLPFGMLPFKALNHYGRVMDFKKASYWFNIIPERRNRQQIRAQLKFNVKEKKATGLLDILSTGYNAVATNELLDQHSKEEYLENMEENIEGDLTLTSHKIREELSNDRKVAERFEIELENILDGDMVYFNPFLMRFFGENPFLLKERTYPVDFGYPRSFKYSINMTIPEGYQVHELPEDKLVRLGEKMVIFQFFHKASQNQVTLTFDLALNSSHIKAEDYQDLKDIFKHVVEVQNNSLVVFKKL